MINIGIIGAIGKMGQRILNIAKNDPEINIIAAIDAPNNQKIGQNVFTDTNSKFSELKYTSKLSEIINKIDVLIDFSIPTVTINNLETIKSNKKALVIGATGFSEEQITKIKNTAKEIPIILAPNMSVGVNVFFKIIKEAAKYLNDYDIELVELHHNQKQDSPSGTAIKIAEIINESTNRSKENWKHGREGLVGKRTKEEIGIHAVRLGDVVGEHSLYFAGNSERIEITHRAHTRDNFANGAIKAAKWLSKKNNGFYDMLDVLDLK